MAPTSSPWHVARQSHPYDRLGVVLLLQGTHLAVGTHKGVVQQWDVAKRTKIREFGGHASRVGALSWRENVVTSGRGASATIHHATAHHTPHTIALSALMSCRQQRSADHQQGRAGAGTTREQADRTPTGGVRSAVVSRQPIPCLRRYTPPAHQPASALPLHADRRGLTESFTRAGNDNRLLIWDVNSTRPMYKYNDHSAAVKAIAWSPHQVRSHVCESRRFMARPVPNVNAHAHYSVGSWRRAEERRIATSDSGTCSTTSPCRPWTPGRRCATSCGPSPSTSWYDSPRPPLFTLPYSDSRASRRSR
jgi:WD40 repeat protein